MAPEEQLAWEARAGRLAALAAFASALLLVASFVAQRVIIEGAPSTDVERVQTIASESTDFLITTALQFLSAALLAPVLWYLYRAIKARRPELPPVARVLAIAGPLVSAAVGVAFQIDLANRAKDLVASGTVTLEAAGDFLEGTSPLLVGLGFAAGLAIGFALVLISLNAMRAGLLSRFMGPIGVVVGALFVLPITSVFPSLYIVPAFWTVALGVLFLDKWPGGRGPAWGSVEAIPWPSAAEQRGATIERNEEPETSQVTTPASNGASADAGARPSKRKRKRRR